MVAALRNERRPAGATSFSAGGRSRLRLGRSLGLGRKFRLARESGLRLKASVAPFCDIARAECQLPPSTQKRVQGGPYKRVVSARSGLWLNGSLRQERRHGLAVTIAATLRGRRLSSHLERFQIEMASKYTSLSCRYLSASLKTRSLSENVEQEDAVDPAWSCSRDL
jgi:hypothetical protein